MAGTLFGIDVSANQGTIDWKRVKTAGLSFSVARCVRETGTVDKTYAANVEGADKAGLIPGAYIFLVGGQAKAQAKTFIRAVGDPSGMLIMLDVERPKIKGNPVPTFADVKTFASEWKAAHPTHPLLVYGSAGSILGSVGTHGKLHDFGPLWLAAYRTGHTHTPAGFYASIGGNQANQWRKAFSGWNGPSIWQFTSGNIHITGIMKGDKFRAVDTNAFRGMREQLLGLAGVGAVPPSPAPATTPAGAKRDADKVFHVVKPGETLSGIAKQFGFRGFRELIAMFPENRKFAANPSLIHPGDKVRVD